MGEWLEKYMKDNNRDERYEKGESLAVPRGGQPVASQS